MTGKKITLKLLELYSLENGPSVFINATTHGNELYGKEICERLYKELELKRGRVTMLPVANPYAYEKRSRTHKRKNLNRRFPGKRDGDVIDRLAYTIFETAKTYDYILDIHSHKPGKVDSVRTPYEYRDLAKVFGLKVKDSKNHYKLKKFRKTLTNQIAKAGKISFTVEIGDACTVDKEKAIDGSERIKIFLKELDMIK